MSFLEVKEVVVFCSECGWNVTYEFAERAPLWIGEMEILHQVEIQKALSEEAEDEDARVPSEFFIPVICDKCSVPYRGDLENGAELYGRCSALLGELEELTEGIATSIEDSDIVEQLPSQDSLLVDARSRRPDMRGMAKGVRNAETQKLARELLPDELGGEIALGLTGGSGRYAELMADLETVRNQHPELDALVQTKCDSLAESLLHRDEFFKNGQIVLDPFAFAQDTDWPSGDKINEDRVWLPRSIDWDDDIGFARSLLVSRIHQLLSAARKDLGQRLRIEFQ